MNTAPVSAARAALDKGSMRPAAPATAEAPLQIELRFQLDVPRAKAFEILTFRLPEWFEGIDHVTYDNARSARGPADVGACSTRTCSMGSKVVVEEIAAYEHGRSYAYRVDMSRSTMKMPVRRHLGTIDIADGDGVSIVTWRQYFEAPVWPVGALVRWYMRDRMMRPAMRVLLRKFGGLQLA